MSQENLVTIIKGYILDRSKSPGKILQDARDILWRTPIEMLICAILVSSLCGSIVSKYERSRKIHLGFSEITQIKRDAEYAGEEVPVATLYLAGLNDMIMKVCERSNWAYKDGKLSLGKFAFELEVEMDPALTHHHHPLYKLLRTVPEDATKFREELKEFSKVRNELEPVNQDFENAWKVDRTDYDRPVQVTTTYTDSEGDTHTETHTEWVYDYSIYLHTYFKEIGGRASKGLDALLKSHWILEYGKIIRTSSKTNAEGEWAAEVSRNKNKRLDKITLEKIATTWKTRSIFNINQSQINRYWEKLKNDANIWGQTKDKVEPQYETRKETISWPGPPEYQLCRQAKGYGVQVQSLIDDIFGGINSAEAQIPLLEADIKQIIAVKLDHKKGNSNEIYERIMKRCKNLSYLNFREGLDGSGKRDYIIILAYGMGALIGALLGGVLDRAGDRFGWWDSKKLTAESIFYRYRGDRDIFS